MNNRAIRARLGRITRRTEYKKLVELFAEHGIDYENPRVVGVRLTYDNVVR